jgi:phosphoserine phosphatase RsbU/P
VEAKSLPASAVGGDFYDFYTPDAERLGVMIGDVSGKGVPAALFMAKLISDFRSTGQRLREPEEILAAMNQGLAGQARRGMFVTVQLLLLDSISGWVRASDGGHVPLLWHHRRSGEVEVLDLPGGPPLGIVPDAAYPGITLQLEHGDSLLLLTDGVLECTNESGEAFGFPRLIETVRTASPADGLYVQPVLRAVEAFTARGRRFDDLTLVQLTWC